MPSATPVMIGTDAGDERPVLFVGDIQGCARELGLLLERADFQAGAHRLVPVGDTINRGPDAAAVLDQLAACGAEPIVGNHERALLDIARSGEVPQWAHAPHSAYAQLQQAGCWEAAAEEMGTWPLVREGPGWIAVHAGLHPRLPTAKTPPEFLTEVRWCDGEGRLPDPLPKLQIEAPPGFAPWYAFYRGQRTVVFGHWAQRGLILEERVRGLDTGCVYGGRLTALWWPEDRLVQVRALQAYRLVRGTVRRLE